MKNKLIVLLILTIVSCRKHQIITYQQCGKVIDKFVVAHSSSTEYVIIYEDTISGKRYECREMTTLTTQSGHPYTTYYPIADIGKPFCETKVKY